MTKLITADRDIHDAILKMIAYLLTKNLLEII